MNLTIKQVLNAAPDVTGTAIGIGFENNKGQKGILEMLMQQGCDLMAKIASAGINAARKHGDPDTPPDGVEHLQSVPTTHAYASYGPNGQPMIGFRFGRTSLGVHLTIGQARFLADQLDKLSVHTPSGKPTSH